MLQPLIRKLEHGADLSDADRQALSGMICQVRSTKAREDLIKEGDKPDHVHLILSGYACRYKVLKNGERQIMAWLVPGDLCDLHVTILGEMDHSLGTLSPCQIAYIPQKAIENFTSKHPAITRALWWATLVDEGILREWLVGMGRRPADQQMAHLFCELMVRLQTVGLVSENSFEFPLTQEELGDTLGLSTVHVNRMLQELREAGFLSLIGKRLTIHEVEGLKAFAEFNPNYLHLSRTASKTARADVAISGRACPRA
jgi:CRP-like cAMP-binding protein